MLIANHLKTKPFKKKIGRLDAISLQNAYLLNYFFFEKKAIY